MRKSLLSYSAISAHWGLPCLACLGEVDVLDAPTIGECTLIGGNPGDSVSIVGVVGNNIFLVTPTIDTHNLLYLLLQSMWQRLFFLFVGSRAYVDACFFCWEFLGIFY